VFLFIPQFWNSIFYTCHLGPGSVHISEPKTTIRSIDGDHFPMKSNEDVESVSFSGCVVNFIPRGLTNNFPSLTVLNINGCRLTSLNRSDLFGLEGLEALYAQANPLKSLPNDLFVGMNRLKQVSFSNNKLEILSSAVFDPIINNGLELLVLSGNVKIDAFYLPGNKNSVATIDELMEIIDSNCNAPIVIDATADLSDQVNFFVGFKQMWQSHELSDFTIHVGIDEFPVHKVILANKSKVFLTFFKNDLKGKRTNKMEIHEFSAAAVKQFLSYLYSGEINIEDNLLELHGLAHKFAVQEIKDITKEIIVNTLNNENAFDVFQLGVFCKDSSMKRAAFELIDQSFPGKLAESLINKPDDLKVVIDAAAAYKYATNEAKQKFDSICRKHNK
jgi:hypothetical protein